MKSELTLLILLLGVVVADHYSWHKHDDDHDTPEEDVGTHGDWYYPDGDQLLDTVHHSLKKRSIG